MKFEDIEPYVKRAAWCEDGDDPQIYYVLPEYCAFLQGKDGYDRTALEYIEVYPDGTVKCVNSEDERWDLKKFKSWNYTFTVYKLTHVVDVKL